MPTRCAKLSFYPICSDPPDASRLIFSFNRGIVGFIRTGTTEGDASLKQSASFLSSSLDRPGANTISVWGPLTAIWLGLPPLWWCQDHGMDFGVSMRDMIDRAQAAVQAISYPHLQNSAKLVHRYGKECFPCRRTQGGRQSQNQSSFAAADFAVVRCRASYGLRDGACLRVAATCMLAATAVARILRDSSAIPCAASAMWRRVAEACLLGCDPGTIAAITAVPYLLQRIEFGLISFSRG